MVRGPDPSRSRLVGAGSLIASILGHLVLAGAGTYLFAAFGSRGARAESVAVGEISVDVVAPESAALRDGPDGQGTVAEIAPASEPLEPGGGEPLARPDMDRRGHAGSLRAASAALNLADRDEGLTLSREVTSRIDRDQIQRLRTSRDRASRDDRRVTVNPMELVFLATGSGHVAERRPLAANNPSRGAEIAPPGAVLGGDIGAAPMTIGAFEPPRDPGGDRAGSLHHSPGAGIARGRQGDDHRISAAVATGRPWVDRAHTSVPADQSGRARDTVDSEQEVAVAVQSLVHASTAGGFLGQGAGGEEGTGPAGSGGLSGPGSRADPFGGGEGAFASLSDLDPRISAYQRSVLAKIQPLWENAFPKWAALEGKQARAIVSFVIYSDGRVDDVRVTRTSGVVEFDENVKGAVHRAAPFGPFPSSLSVPSKRWNITFDMNNPVVR